MKNEYFNEREKRLFNSFSNKDNYYKGSFFGETNPIIDNKINKIEKRFVKSYKEQLKKTKDKDRKEELLECITLYEKHKIEVEKVEHTVVPIIVKESAIKKPKEKTKELFFKIAEPYRKDYSRLVYWCDPFEPINKGKLGTTQGWRKEQTFKQYY
jgi:hypothetical protein